jgi:hypothetical protein
LGALGEHELVIIMMVVVVPRKLLLIFLLCFCKVDIKTMAWMIISKEK